MSTLSGQAFSSTGKALVYAPSTWTAQEKSCSYKASGLVGTRERENSFTDSPERRFSKSGKAENAVGSETSLKLKELQRLFRHRSISANRTWVLWSAEQLTEAFACDLRKDDCLGTLVLSRS